MNDRKAMLSGPQGFKVLFRYSEGICDFSSKRFPSTQSAAAYGEERVKASPSVVGFWIVTEETTLMEAIDGRR